MVRAIILVLALLVLSCGPAVTAVPSYTLRPVADGNDAALCGRDGGLASLVARIAPDGTVISDWEAFCLVPVK